MVPSGTRRMATKGYHAGGLCHVVGACRSQWLTNRSRLFGSSSAWDYRLTSDLEREDAARRRREANSHAVTVSSRGRAAEKASILVSLSSRYDRRYCFADAGASSRAWQLARSNLSIVGRDLGTCKAHPKARISSTLPSRTAVRARVRIAAGIWFTDDGTLMPRV